MSKIIYVLLTILVLSLLSGCVVQTQKTEVVRMDVSQKKVLMIVPPEDFRDEELFEPKSILESGGAQISIASKGVQTATGSEGGSIPVSIDINKVDVTNYDAIVFIGGNGASVYFDDSSAIRIAKDAVAQNKILGAICMAPTILANAGVLEGKQATVHMSQSETIKEKIGTYTGQAITIDGKIITASGPESATNFGMELGKLLSN